MYANEEAMASRMGNPMVKKFHEEVKALGCQVKITKLKPIKEA